MERIVKGACDENDQCDRQLQALFKTPQLLAACSQIISERDQAICVVAQCAPAAGQCWQN